MKTQKTCGLVFFCDEEQMPEIARGVEDFLKTSGAYLVCLRLSPRKLYITAGKENGGGKDEHSP